MAIKRTKSQKQTQQETERYQLGEVAYRFRNTVPVDRVVEREAQSRNSFEQVFPYPVSLLYQDLVKTATLAVIMIVSLLVIWRLGLVH